MLWKSKLNTKTIFFGFSSVQHCKVIPTNMKHFNTECRHVSLAVYLKPVSLNGFSTAAASEQH